MTDMDTTRRLLVARLNEITQRTITINDELCRPRQADWDDSATESEDDEVLASLGNRALREFGQIKRAIGAIDNGTYGVCQCCKNRIASERLEAIPFSQTCTVCS